MHNSARAPARNLACLAAGAALFVRARGGAQGTGTSVTPDEAIERRDHILARAELEAILGRGL